MKRIGTYQKNWKGRGYTSEVYLTEDVMGLSPVTQIQAVCFTQDQDVVLVKHKYGWLGLPGGHIDKGESYESALSRELFEEAAVTLLDWGLFACEKVYYNDTPDDVSYFLRCWAKVKVLNDEIHDPDGKAIGREIVSFDQALKKLGYGESGKIYLREAKKYI